MALITEDKARHTKYCVVCGKEKSPLAVVCWDCFKSGTDPLKWTELTTNDWLAKHIKDHSERARRGEFKIKGVPTF